ncbi:NAD(P)/FAD-dependent oxidoreductase [Sphingomonas sp.]|jgi:thioredoxin reductase (NADPH)|uniref:NAD(P)/FAD-dependent oxidoreductase n=1 Tax=Sphingomonas sp. TaxID=28214 RepID=UPI002D80FAAE|nr:NAD(P)/FAD-dependent oxidoreductase [Sphingomonas sp.]HEU0043539.1 NAD(P)/FAD-dependent oxidoreductase [Sphingomonas sp.]
MIDCLVIGGGPAGVTAAIYLARFHLSVRVVDAGQSRVTWIPKTHNHAGYPGGIKGTELLERMRAQAAEFGVTVETGVVEHLGRAQAGFEARLTEGETLAARSVLLATGVVNKQPPISPELHPVALERGLIRYCPICDGYEVTDKRVGVIGNRTHGFKEAVFLRTYTSDVTLIAPDQDIELSDEEHVKLDELGIEAVAGPCASLRIEGERIVAPTPRGELEFDSIYPALGSVIRSELAMALGAEGSSDGCLVVDDHQRTSIPGLYAAGDVVKGLDQISHAMGEGGVAATTIRNDLAERRSLAR